MGGETWAILDDNMNGDSMIINRFSNVTGNSACNLFFIHEWFRVASGIFFFLFESGGPSIVVFIEA
jgi:hypothetical protein